jgi:hypothetical protein
MAQDRIDLNEETSMAHPEVFAVYDDDDDVYLNKLQRKVLQKLFST